MSQNNKVGSSHEATDKAVHEKTDFGVHAGDRQEAEYASHATEHQDPGSGTERSGTGPRDSGVGGNDSGPGSSSGGDINVGGDALTGVGDANQHPARHGSEAADTETEQPLEHPATGVATTHGDTDTASSTSADGANNEMFVDDEAAKGDLTADEAAGNSSR